MSHFSAIKTRMVDKEYLKQALKALGYACEDGAVEIRGFGGKRTPVELKMPTRNPDYDIGFRKSGDAYELVADWYGIRDEKQGQFLERVTQRYAYCAARAKLEEQGFAVATEETEKDGRIRLVLRRMI
jgi:hypothetical protein